MQDKIKFSFTDEDGNVEKYYIGYDFSKAGSCCGIQILADIHLAKWQHTCDEDEEEGYYSTLSYRQINKALKMEAFTILWDYMLRVWPYYVIMLKCVATTGQYILQENTLNGMIGILTA